MSYHYKQVVWAKVKGYPWWPAEINKLPQDQNGTFKVLFFAEQTYALLEPKFVQKFADNYIEYSKTKSKKFSKALQQANNSAQRQCTEIKNKKINPNRKKVQKRQQAHQQVRSQQVESQIEESSNNKRDNQQSLNLNSPEKMEQSLIEQVDKKKIQKIQDQLSNIITQFQTNKVKQWKYSKYFQSFKNQHNLNSQQLLHSNITRKIRFIIQNMKKLKLNQQQIMKLEQISSSLKQQVLDYLTDTTYYDQHIKLIDKSKSNKLQVQNQIIRIMKRKYDSQIKRQFINILALQVGKQIGTKSKFNCKQLIADLKQGKYDNVIKHISSKAATQRLAQQLIQRYRCKD